MNKKIYHPSDVRTWSAKTAISFFNKAENTYRQAKFTYLLSRGWTMLCGINGKFCVKPNQTYNSTDIILYTLDEAIDMQKKNDKNII